MRDLYDQLTTRKQDPHPSVPSAQEEAEALREALIECGDIEGTVTE